MENMNYIAFVHSDDAGYGISFPDFPGCISVGTTKEDAISHGAEALALHIEGLVEDGLPIPCPRSANDIKADPDLKECSNGADLELVPSVAHFVNSLADTPDGPLFNPWFQQDELNDQGPEAPTVRRQYLTHYLTARVGRAKYLLIAEAPSCRGAHFSGIAMTSERILLGHLRGVRSTDVLPYLEPTRTSSGQAFQAKIVRRLGYAERTATIAWRFLLSNLHLDPLDFVLWNAVPWHPYDINKGMLSNRTPKQSEQDASRDHLTRFLALYPNARRIAVGRISKKLLEGCGDVAGCVEHPASRSGDFKADLTRVAHTLGLSVQ